MTISNLTKTLNGNILNGNLRLNKTTLGSRNIQLLFENLLSDNKLEIRSVDLTVSTDSLIAKGKASLFSLTNIPVEAKFHLESGEPQMSLTAQLPNNWKFTQSFPKLGISILTQMKLPEREFLFDKLAFQQPRLILDSSQAIESKQVTKIKFEAKLPIDDNILPLSQFFPGISPLRIVGSIIPTGKGTEVFLNSSIIGDISLGYLRVPFLEFDLVADVIDEPGSEISPYTSAYFGLETEVQVGTPNKPIRLPIYGTFRGSQQDLEFEADLEDFSLSGLSQLSGLLNKTELADLLPESFRMEQGLILSKLSFSVSPRAKKLQQVALTVKSVQPWQISGKIAIENVSIYFLVNNPTDSQKRKVICDISGELNIKNNVRFSIGAALPEFAIHGYLTEGELNLTNLIKHFALDEVPVPDGFPNIVFSSLGVTLNPKDRSFSLSGAASTDWEIIPQMLLLKEVETNFEVTRIAGKTTVSGLILGKLTVAGSEVNLYADIEEKFALRGEISRLNLSAIIEEFFELADLPADLPNFELTDIEITVTPKTGEFLLSAKSAGTWKIPVGIDGLEIENISLLVKRAIDPTLPNSSKQKHSVTGVITGTLEIGTNRLTTEYRFPGDFVLQGTIPSFSLSPLVQDLCGSDGVRGLSVPPEFLALALSNVVVSIAPQKKSFSISATSGLGQVELVVKKNANRWGFVAGFIPPTKWKFSDISTDLRALDGIRFSDTALILSSTADQKFGLTEIKSKRKDVAIIQGLNFFASLDMSGLGVNELLGVKSLNVYAAISEKPSDLVLEASIDGSFDLGGGVAFGDLKLRLKPAPSDFSLTLSVTVTAILNNSTLKFIGGGQVKPRSASFQATMLGVWKDPFDAKGVTIADFAIELGASFPPLLPIVAFAGTLQIGDFKGAVAVKFDSAMPSRSMLAIAFNRLYLMDVIRAFCGPKVAQSIPDSLTKTILDIGFEDVNIYIVPQTTVIGELQFEQGIHLAGKMQFWGLRASGLLTIDHLEGIEAKGDMDAINVAGIFKLTGAAGRPNPSLYLKITPKTIPNLEISAAVELLGISRDVQISLSDNGFYFMTSAKIFNLFECKLEVEGQDLRKGGDFLIKVTMKNDLLEYLRTEASNAIHAAAKAATEKLSEAQAAVANAQREVDKLNIDIDNMRRTIQQERDRDSQRMRDAQAAVQSAQNNVNQLEQNIINMRQTIQQERFRDSQRMRDAQAAVQSAQNNVNSLQQEIDSSKRWIEILKQNIRDKQKWYDNLPWWDQAWAWIELSGYATGKGLEITGVYTKIGGIESAKGIALGVLEAAKQVVRSLEITINNFPIDADVRVAALITAKETANGILEGAKQIVRSLEITIVNFPIDADFRIAGLFTAKETATGVLFLAIQTLEGLKISVAAAAQVGQFIVDVGLGGLLDIKSASFEGRLGAAKGGSVTLELTVVFMKGQPQTFTFSFNFYDPLSGAKELAKQLLPA